MIQGESDGRPFSICRRCRRFIYHRSLSRGPFEQIRDAIADGVVGQGSYELPSEILRNTAFRPMTNGPTFLENIKVWADANYLTFAERGETLVFERDELTLLRLLEAQLLDQLEDIRRRERP